MACIPYRARDAMYGVAYVCVSVCIGLVCASSGLLFLTPFAPLTTTRWRWVVEAPAAAPFDLPGHAPFFHFFTP